VQHADSSATSGNTDDRRAIILTWHPDKFWWGGGYFDAVEQTAQGVGVVGDWSTGNRTGGVSARVLACRSGTTSEGRPGRRVTASWNGCARAVWRWVWLGEHGVDHCAGHHCHHCHVEPDQQDCFGTHCASVLARRVRQSRSRRVTVRGMHVTQVDPGDI
jgi:hypothetical protein